MRGSIAKPKVDQNDIAVGETKQLAVDGGGGPRRYTGHKAELERR